MANDSDKHGYYANAIGFVAFCAFLAFMSKGCTELSVEREKAEQLKIIHQKK
jgi:hypothetical protein